MSVSLDSRAPRRLLVGIAAVLLMAGCTVEDGDTGPQGPPGPPAVQVEGTVAPEEVNPTIKSVSASSPFVVNFWVTDERGFAVIGIEASEVDFTVNKLVPGTDGETNVWRSYVWADDEGTTNAQASTIGADSAGTLEDHGNGAYTFTFDEMPGALSSKAGTGYEPGLTHRVGIELRDVTILGKEIPAGSNSVFDLVPSGGSVTGRTIAETESCQTCHGPEAFSFHGGPRKQVEYCVTCHQKGSVDAGTGNTMDFRVMIHKIHMGEELPSVVLGPDLQDGTADDGTGTYEFCGFGCERFGSSPDDFSHVAFPQDQRNCTTCHDPSDTDTPQASNVFDSPTAAVCASCHDDLAFDDSGLTNANGNHEVGLAQPNSNCVNCHSTGGLAPENAHKIPGQIAAGRFEYNILTIAQTGQGQEPQVTFSVTDPTNGDAAYDLQNADEFTTTGANLRMLIAWPTSDYTNFDPDTGSVTGSAPSQPRRIDLLQGLPVVTDNGNGTYTMHATELDGGAGFSIPSTQTGSGSVVIEGHPMTEIEGSFVRAPVTGAVKAFAITDSSAEARRTVVDNAKCQNCHNKNDGLAFHGDNRADNTQQCVVCHNPNQTDLAGRPVDVDGVDLDGSGTPVADNELFDGVSTAADDNLEDRTIDFKYMIHAIHGSERRQTPYIAYSPFSGAHNYSTVGFPRPASDCLACHQEGTYELPLGDNVLATTLSSGATETNSGYDGAGGIGDGSAPDPGDDNNASPTAAVCSSCHDSTDAADHMDTAGTDPTSFGNAYLLADSIYPHDDNGTPSDPTDDTISDANAHTQTLLDGEPAENCAFCHGPGAIADVAEVHGVE